MYPYSGVIPNLLLKNSNTPKAMLKPDRVVSLTCSVFGIPKQMIFNRGRSMPFVMARQMAMSLLRSNTNMTLKEIGIFFGDYDHTTVLHSCVAVSNMLDTDKKLRDLYYSIEQNL